MNLTAWCLAFLQASSSICVKVVVELQILKSGRARDVHAPTVSPCSSYFDIFVCLRITRLLFSDIQLYRNN